MDRQIKNGIEGVTDVTKKLYKTLTGKPYIPRRRVPVRNRFDNSVIEYEISQVYHILQRCTGEINAISNDLDYALYMQNRSSYRTYVYRINYPRPLASCCADVVSCIDVLDKGISFLRAHNHNLECQLYVAYQKVADYTMVNRRLQDEVNVYFKSNLAMKTTITYLNQEKRDMEHRIKKLQFQVEKHTAELLYKETETKNYRHRVFTRLTNHNLEAEWPCKQFTEASRELKITKRERNDLPERMNNYKEEAEGLRKKLKDVSNELETTKQENEVLRVRMIDYEMHARCLNKQLPEATKELETIKQEREDLLKRMNNHKEEAKSFHKKLQEASSKVETTMQENKNFQIRIDNLEMEAKGLSKQLSDVSKELKKVQGDKEKFRLSADYLEKQVEEFSKQLAEATKGLKTMKQEKDELLMRLSQYTSAKLIQDNPNVTDLSDLNRPTKLAEKFSELYDNEWTDGFDVLTNEFNFKEREAIQKLLDILKDAYQYCVKTSNRQDRVIRNALLCPNMNDYQENADQEIELVQLRNIHDLRKEASQNAAKNIKQGFMDLLKSSELNSADVVSSCDYVNQCIQLCWQMVLRSPPLSIDMTTFIGDDFDKTKYRFYQSSGSKYSYIVWPALYLHKNGPLLVKGIAEAV